LESTLQVIVELELDVELEVELEVEVEVELEVELVEALFFTAGPGVVISSCDATQFKAAMLSGC